MIRYIEGAIVSAPLPPEDGSAVGVGERVVSIRQAWRTACKKAKLIGKIPHDFRRSAVRRLERAGVPRSVAMKLVGHRTEAIYRRYAITNESDLREGLAKVANMEASKPSLRIERA